MDKPLSEEEMVRLEEQIPYLAAEAFAKARKEALDAGLSVLECDGGVLYEVHPDGRRVFVKNVAPPISVGTGFSISS